MNWYEKSIKEAACGGSSGSSQIYSIQDSIQNREDIVPSLLRKKKKKKKYPFSS